MKELKVKRESTVHVEKLVHQVLQERRVALVFLDSPAILDLLVKRQREDLLADEAKEVPKERLVFPDL